MAAVFFMIGAISGPAAHNEPWYQRDYMSLGPAEVIGALAALSTGTIALQVMAQTAFSRQSKTLKEFNHRQNMGILALMSPAVSCTLAIFAVVDGDNKLPSALAYILIVITISGMNTFIAADAADRLLRVDDNNLDIQLADSRRKVGHYRRKRLPQQPGTSLSLRFGRAGWHLFMVSTAVTTGDAMLLPAVDWTRAPRYFLGLTLSTTVISLLAFMALRYWFGVDRTDRWGFLLLFVAGILVLAIVISEVATRNTLGHVAIILGIPVTLALAGVKTKLNRSAWLVASWVPGTWIREEVSRTVNTASKKANNRLIKLKADKMANAPVLSTGVWGLLAERSRTLLGL